MSNQKLDISRPLFEEPPDDLDEDSTWGFLLGGMAWKEGYLPADEFLLAANALVDHALRERDLSYEYMPPIMYLYRHALELYLKQIVRPTRRNHDLPYLIGEFEKVLQRDHHQSLPAPIRSWLMEWATHDPTSTNFRYSIGGPDGEYWVNMHHLRRVMNFLAENFKRMRWSHGTAKQRAGRPA